MEIISSLIKDWKSSEGGKITTPEGFALTPIQKKQICEFNKIPATLVGVDSKFGTNTVLDVLSSASTTGKVDFLVENNEIVSVLDPKSHFVSDKAFDEITDQLAQLTSRDNFSTEVHGAAKRAVFKLDETDTDEFLGDVFRKQLIVERLSQGGLFISGGLLRLICTNGALVGDSQFKHLIRTGNVTPELLKVITSDMEKFSVKGYFDSLFSNRGEVLQASVADFLGMKQTLQSATDDDIADIFFPEEPIVTHYLSQGIDISKISRNVCNRLPSGLTYYDTYNILTHGIKNAGKLDLDTEIKVANWARPSKIRQLQDTTIQFQGVPEFNPKLIQSLKGDVQ